MEGVVGVPGHWGEGLRRPGGLTRPRAAQSGLTLPGTGRTLLPDASSRLWGEGQVWDSGPQAPFPTWPVAGGAPLRSLQPPERGHGVPTAPHALGHHRKCRFAFFGPPYSAAHLNFKT